MIWENKNYKLKIFELALLKGRKTCSTQGYLMRSP